MFDFFSRSLREIKKQSADEEKLLKRTADDLKRSFEDRNDFSKKSLLGFHHKPLEKKATPDQ